MIGLYPILIIRIHGFERRCYKWPTIVAKEQVLVEHQHSLYEFIVDGYKNCLKDSKNCTNFNALLWDVIVHRVIVKFTREIFLSLVGDHPVPLAPFSFKTVILNLVIFWKAEFINTSRASSLACLLTTSFWRLSQLDRIPIPIPSPFVTGNLASQCGCLSDWPPNHR